MTIHSADCLPSSEELMQTFLRAMARNAGGTREGWLAREALHSIARLMRAEQLCEIRRSVNKLVPESLLPVPVKRPKSRRNPRRQPGQTQLAFGRDE